jgi:L-2-hydroxyglutarate oxidase LhgO
MEDLTEGGAGVRAQAMNMNGTLEQDFVIERGEGMLHVLNAPSPGATASLAIADHLIDEIKQDLN